MTKLTTDSVRYSYSSRGEGVWRMVELDYEFDAWLNSVKAEVWDEGYYRGSDLEMPQSNVVNPYRTKQGDNR